MTECTFTKDDVFVFCSVRSDRGYASVSKMLFSGSGGGLLYFPAEENSSKVCGIPRKARVVNFETFTRARARTKIVLPSSLGLVRSRTFTLTTFVPAGEGSAERCNCC